MPTKAVLLGSLGPLVEPENLQRRALNAAFAEAGLDWEWSADEFRCRSHRSMGSTCIAEYARGRGCRVDAASIDRRRSAIYSTMLSGRGASRRVGFDRMIASVRCSGLRLGLVTTAPPEDVEAMLAMAGIDRDRFAFVGDATMVAAPKPAPAIYHVALDHLGLRPDEAIAIEDSEENARAAKDAGIPCAAFPGAAYPARALVAARENAVRSVGRQVAARA